MQHRISVLPDNTISVYLQNQQTRLLKQNIPVHTRLAGPFSYTLTLAPTQQNIEPESPQRPFHSQLVLAHPPGTFLTALIGILTGALYRADFLGLNAFRLSHPIQSFSTRTLTPLLGSLDPPVRSNRALPDAFVPPNTVVEDEPITTARPTATHSESEPPRAAEDSTTTPAAAASDPSAHEEGDAQIDLDTDRRHNAHIRRQSIMNQWVDELIGRGSAAGVRVPTTDEIAQLSSMFPDAPRERVLLALQRRYASFYSLLVFCS